MLTMSDRSVRVHVIQEESSVKDLGPAQICNMPRNIHFNSALPLRDGVMPVWHGGIYSNVPYPQSEHASNFSRNLLHKSMSIRRYQDLFPLYNYIAKVTVLKIVYTALKVRDIKNLDFQTTFFNIRIIII